MKALVLAGGRGKRLDHISEKMNKCMIPILGRPVLELNLQNAVAAGVEEIILVVGYRAEEIINHFGIAFQGKRIRYVIQWEQLGVVHAVECAREAIGASDFFLFLGDEVLWRPHHADMVAEFRKGDVFALCGVLNVKDRDLIRRTYTLIQNEGQVIHRLVEKPRNPLNDIMGTGGCIFRNEALKYIDFTPIHQERREKELPDLIQCAIDDGKLVKSFRICDKYVNINSFEDLSAAEGFSFESPG